MTGYILRWLSLPLALVALLGVLVTGIIGGITAGVLTVLTRWPAAAFILQLLLVYILVLKGVFQ